MEALLFSVEFTAQGGRSGSGGSWILEKFIKDGLGGVWGVFGPDDEPS